MNLCTHRDGAGRGAALLAQTQHRSLLRLDAIPDLMVSGTPVSASPSGHPSEQTVIGGTPHHTNNDGSNNMQQAQIDTYHNATMQ
jgi:hypothetical protein